MALRDVKNYFKKVEEQYSRTLARTSEYDEALKEGYFNQEQYDQANAILSKVIENYKRLAYIMFLLDRPARPKKAKKYDSKKKNIADSLEDSSEEWIIREDENALARFEKEFMEPLKKKKSGDK